MYANMCPHREYIFFLGQPTKRASFANKRNQSPLEKWVIAGLGREPILFQKEGSTQRTIGTCQKYIKPLFKSGQFESQNM